MSNHSIIQSNLDLLARFGRTQHSSTGAGEESSQTTFNRDLVAAFDQSRCRGTARAGSRVESPIGMPSTFFVGDFQRQGMVSFAKSRPHGSDRGVGAELPIAFLKFGAIEAADARLTGVQSQSLGNDRVEGLRAGGGGGDRGWFDRRKWCVRWSPPRLWNSHRKTGRSGRANRSQRRGRRNRRAAVGHFERVIATRFAFEFGRSQRERRVALHHTSCCKVTRLEANAATGRKHQPRRRFATSRRSSSAAWMDWLFISNSRWVRIKLMSSLVGSTLEASKKPCRMFPAPFSVGVVLMA